jgi:hypothetical protein
VDADTFPPTSYDKRCSAPGAASSPRLCRLSRRPRSSQGARRQWPRSPLSTRLRGRSGRWARSLCESAFSPRKRQRLNLFPRGRYAAHSVPSHSAGMSALTPQHICDAAQELGEGLHRALAAPTTEFAKGAVSPALRPVFFGARLIGLLKRGGGFRPIACGGVFFFFGASPAAYWPSGSNATTRLQASGRGRGGRCGHLNPREAMRQTCQQRVPS